MVVGLRVVVVSFRVVEVGLGVAVVTGFVVNRLQLLQQLHPVTGFRVV